MDWKKYRGYLVLISIYIIFLVLLIIMGTGNLIIGDERLFMVLNPPFNPANPTIFDQFFVYFSTWGPGDFGLAIWGFIPFILIFLFLSLKFPELRPMRFILLLAVVGMLIGYLGITTVVKNIFIRERPFMDFVLSSSANDWVPFFYSTTPQAMFDLGLKSFPSGHATAGFVFATPFILIYKNYLIKTLAIIYGILTSYARIFLGVHYPTDVFVGILVGILTVWFFFILFRKYLLPRAPWFRYEEEE